NNNDKFVIPENIRNNKTNLENFIKDILHKLNSLWERANTNKNSNDEKIRDRAKSVLTIKSHLETKIRDIHTMKPIKEKSINWKIKMWDRNPQKDIFQGNYSTCCIGMNEINSSAMPNYILNTMFNMIEIVDNNTGRTVGNALCYYAKNISNEIYFVIDNIEINNHYKLSDKRGEELRNSIKKFAQNVNKEVSGKDNIPIILGGEDLNDVPTDKLRERHNVLSKLGSMNCEEIYADLFGGWSDMQTDSTSYYQL
ncbi:MAG: hypothetical protein MJ180_05940, partial [Candidatus Gastranaerophilales bacterium]|nr:hypothetical protein [Candidatus Gastranaerophilales bacterium]